MGTFYMVEMDFRDPHERPAFDEYYSNHITMLLGIEGFISAQRFETSHTATSPLLAIYELTSPDVITSRAYTSRAGRSSIARRYQPKMHRWHRNLFDGPDFDPAVPMQSTLVVIDRVNGQSQALPREFTPLRPIGLDRTVTERGLAIKAAAWAGTVADFSSSNDWVVRLMKPLHPMRRKTPRLE